MGNFYHYFKAKILCCQIFTICISHTSLPEEFYRPHLLHPLWCELRYFRAWKGNANRNYTRKTSQNQDHPQQTQTCSLFNDFGGMHKKIPTLIALNNKTDLFSHVPEKPRDGMNLLCGLSWDLAFFCITIYLLTSVHWNFHQTGFYYDGLIDAVVLDLIFAPQMV